MPRGTKPLHRFVSNTIRWSACDGSQERLAYFPPLAEWLRRKRAFDPGELSQSDWCRHHKALLGMP